MKTKKLMAVIMTAVLASTMMLSGCTTKKQTENSKQASSENTQAGALPLSKEKVKLQWMLQEHATYPIKQDWEFLKEIEKLTNVQIEIIPGPAQNYNEKANVMMASGQMPDIMAITGSEVNKQHSSGLFLPVSDYLDKNAPNYKKYLNDANYATSLKPAATAADGKVYAFIQLADNAPTKGWLYRKDVFTKEGIKTPVTTEELYTALKTLKTKYPNSNPFSSRNAKDGWFLTNFHSLWNVKAQPSDLFQMDNGKAVFSPSLSRYKDMVDFARRLFADGLIAKDFPLETAQTWQQKMQTGTSFVTYDWAYRYTNFNQDNEKAGDKKIQGYDMAIMLPAKPANGPGYIEAAEPITGLYNIISAKTKYPEVAVGYMDFLFSEKGRELAYWGIEGKTFEKDSKGVRKFTKTVQSFDNPTGAPQQSLGLAYNNLNQVGLLSNDERAYMQAPGLAEYIKQVTDKKLMMAVEPRTNSTPEESEYYNARRTQIQKYFAENIDKFIMGKRPMSEWETFIKEFDKFNIDKMTEIRQAQYDRMYGKK